MANVVDGAKGSSSKGEAKRAPPLRAELNDSFIARLRREKPPTGYDKKGKLVFASEEDLTSTGYILWDASRDAPPGFGVKVAGKKTYILRRKVHGKSILAKVGNFGDYNGSTPSGACRKPCRRPPKEPSVPDGLPRRTGDCARSPRSQPQLARAAPGSHACGDSQSGPRTQPGS